MPALIRSVGASSRGGFSTNASTRPSASVGTTPNADGSSTWCRAIVPSAPRSSWNAIEGADVEVGEHVAVDHQEPLGDAGVEGGEADGARGVERLGLDRVVELDAGAQAVGLRLDERVGPVAHRQHGLVDAVTRPGARATCSIIGRCRIGSICLGRVKVSGREPVPNPPTRTTALMAWSERVVAGGVVAAEPSVVVRRLLVGRRPWWPACGRVLGWSTRRRRAAAVSVRRAATRFGADARGRCWVWPFGRKARVKAS